MAPRMTPERPSIIAGDAVSQPCSAISGLTYVVWLAGSLLVSAAMPAADPPKAATAASAPAGAAKTESAYSPGVPDSGRNFYAIAWGVDQLSATWPSPGSWCASATA